MNLEEMKKLDASRQRVVDLCFAITPAMWDSAVALTAEAIQRAKTGPVPTARNSQ